MNFEWDDTKNKKNFLKHGVWFEEAQTLWVDSHAAEFYDPTHSDNEDRFIRIGRSARTRILLVVYCERHSGRTIRIISARQSTRKEKRDYEEGI